MFSCVKSSFGRPHVVCMEPQMNAWFACHRVRISNIYQRYQQRFFIKKSFFINSWRSFLSGLFCVLKFVSLKLCRLGLTSEHIDSIIAHSSPHLEVINKIFFGWKLETVYITLWLITDGEVRKFKFFYFYSKSIPSLISKNSNISSSFKLVPWILMNINEYTHADMLDPWWYLTRSKF